MTYKVGMAKGKVRNKGIKGGIIERRKEEERREGTDIYVGKGGRENEENGSDNK
jgi:hypothetical protein